jgi:cytoskeletal protein RodZ
MESIGEALRQEREKQGLALDEVHEATRITAQNLTALEEDRFDSFPNKVYARAFLRDYANFLGMDSAGLVERLEEELRGGAETETGPGPVRARSRVLAYTLLVIVVTGGLAAVGYYGWSAHERQLKVAQSASSAPAHVRRDRTLPEPPKPSGQPAIESGAPPPSVPANKIVMEVTALGMVWTHVKADGVTKQFANIPKGQTMRFEAARSIYIRVGRANAVRVTVNGEPKVFGDESRPVTKVFTLPEQEPTAPAGR